MAGSPRVLVLRAAGINCDEETAAAAALAGGSPERIHVNRLAGGECNLLDYAALIIPGGFSYGDHLGAGKSLHFYAWPGQAFLLTRGPWRRAPGSRRRYPRSAGGASTGRRALRRCTWSANSSISPESERLGASSCRVV